MLVTELILGAACLFFFFFFQFLVFIVAFLLCYLCWEYKRPVVSPNASQLSIKCRPTYDPKPHPVHESGPIEMSLSPTCPSLAPSLSWRGVYVLPAKDGSWSHTRSHMPVLAAATTLKSLAGPSLS